MIFVVALLWEGLEARDGEEVEEDGRSVWLLRRREGGIYAFLLGEYCV